MRVLVMGSYRPQEGQRGFARDAGDRFRAAAHALGRSLAEQGHDLLVGWSYANVPSQLGVKRQGGRYVTRHPKAHPYWETADFHALRGFLSVVRHYHATDGRRRVFVRTVGRSDELPDAPPFPSPAVLADLEGAPLARCRTGPGEEPSTAFDPAEAVDLRDVATAALVDVRHGGEVNSSAARQELLVELAREAGAVVSLGGGKATIAAIAQGGRGRLLIPAPFSREGAFSAEEEAERGSQSDRLQAMWAELAGRTRGTTAELVREIPRRLEALTAAAADPGPEIPYRSGAFRASGALVAGVVVALMALVYAAAADKGASLWGTVAVEAFALALFATVLGLQFAKLFSGRPRPARVFLGVVGAGIVASAAMLGSMTDLLGLIEPRLAVADGPIAATVPPPPSPSRP